jgi:hypothetical protein
LTTPPTPFTISKTDKVPSMNILPDNSFTLNKSPTLDLPLSPPVSPILTIKDQEEPVSSPPIKQPITNIYVPKTYVSKSYRELERVNWGRPRGYGALLRNNEKNIDPGLGKYVKPEVDNKYKLVINKQNRRQVSFGSRYI